jgi:hypothetical protein
MILDADRCGLDAVSYAKCAVVRFEKECQNSDVVRYELTWA